ncbi:type IV secretion system protein [Rhizobium sp. NFACC06-2]|uniref:type IV secretion system protein n=1 Tax=Rhizobium sp. NFACC06-2 TaxID=1566264 RepID=UPI00165ED452|nr:type IV secretion system protein [Rhizobium sp. NFACC06-2]
MNHIDQSVIEYAEDVFNAVAIPIRSLLQAMGLVGLLFIAVNTLIQFRQINYSEYMGWGIRFILIYSFATIWANFRLIYDAVSTLPDEYISIVMQYFSTRITTHRTDILDPSKINDMYTAMDEFAHAIIWIAWDYIRDVSINNIGKTMRNLLIGLVIILLGAIFTAISAILVAFSKIGFAAAVGLAPLAIVLLMMEQTKNYFETWLRFTCGFLCIPLITGMLMALIFYIASAMLTQSDAGSDNKDAYFYFLFMMAAAVIMLSQVPTMASTLGGASVAAVGASMASSRGMMNNARKLGHAAQRVRDGAGVANQARRNGAGPGGIAMAAISGMRQSALSRGSRRDQRLASRMHEKPKVSEKDVAAATNAAATNAPANKVPAASSATNTDLKKPQDKTVGQMRVSDLADMLKAASARNQATNKTSGDKGSEATSTSDKTNEKNAAEQNRSSQALKEAASTKMQSGEKDIRSALEPGSRAGPEKRASSQHPSGNSAPKTKDKPEDD